MGFDVTVEKKILIIGGDGILGRGVLSALQKEGANVFSTTRHEENVDSETFYLDFCESSENWDLPDADVCLIAAAITKTNDCRLNYDAAWDVNVRASIDLAKEMVAKGARVLFLSTNQVFDGNTEFRKANDEKNPTSAYGKQKAAAEDGILALSESCAVLRMTKVLEDHAPLLKSWKTALKAGESVNAFGDMVMSPVSLQSVIKLIVILLKGNATGIYQASGNIDVSYAKVAKWISNKVNAPEKLVRVITSSDAGIVELPPRFTTLDVSRLKDICDFQLENVWDVIAKSVELD